jgi:S-layer homology domain
MTMSRRVRRPSIGGASRSPASRQSDPHGACLRRGDSHGAVPRCALVPTLVLALVLLATFMAAPALAFVDVPSDNPYNAAVTDLVARGIVSGYDPEHFGPGDPLLRQQFAKLVVLTFDLPVSGDDICRFTDVANISGFYPDKLIEAAAIAKIIQGKTATTFDPRGQVTRAQVLTMVVRGADQLHPGLLEAPGPLFPSPWGKFDDGTHWKNAAKAMKNDLLVGIDFSGKSPTDPMPRGEVAQVLFNLLKRMENVDLDAGSIIDVGGGTQKVLGFIHQAWQTEDGGRHLVVDPVQLLLGAEAKTAAVADGVIPADGTLDNDCYVRNRGGRLYPYDASENVTVKEWTYPVEALIMGRAMTWPKFIMLWHTTGDELRHVRAIPYWLYLSGGRVTAIEEQYLP